MVISFGSFGLGGEAREALEGGLDTIELEFEFEGAFLERGHGAETGEASLEISEGRGRICDEGIGLEPEFGLGFWEVAQRELKIALGADGVAATRARAGAEDAGGGVRGMGNEMRGERVDGREGFIAREKILRSGQR